MFRSVQEEETTARVMSMTVLNAFCTATLVVVCYFQNIEQCVGRIDISMLKKEHLVL
jgi:hypothetical protein